MIIEFSFDHQNMYHCMTNDSYLYSDEFDGFTRKENTGCLGKVVYPSLYAFEREECPTKCREMEECTAFTMADTKSYFGDKMFLCTLYAGCADKSGVTGTDLYFIERSVFFI